MKQSYYTHHDEGRLASVVAVSNTMTTFLYDGLGRLRKQLQWSYYAGSTTNGGGGSSSSELAVVPASAPGGGSGSGWQPAGGTYYIYDGMRVIQERDTNNTPTVSYTRGIDLSGTLQGVGGIGGLLARSADYSGGVFSQHDYYHADGQGNITYLADNTQSQAASYAYDPYGNLLSSAGTLATANTYRFSSREYVPSSGLYVYLYRFYNPGTERWLNQDPIGEVGGINLYENGNNNLLLFLDPYGLTPGGIITGGAIGGTIGLWGGAIIGGILGGTGGGVGGAIGGTALEPGGGTVAGAVSGTVAGSAAGAATGADIGAAIGSVAGAWIGGVVTWQQGNGERNIQGNDPNPWKGWRPDKDRPGWGWKRDPQTGHKIPKPRPCGPPPPNHPNW